MSDTSEIKTSLSQAELAGPLQLLSDTNAAFAASYPGIQITRQPVHTVYGGAQLYKPGATTKLADLALRHLDEYAPDAVTFARALGLAEAAQLKVAQDYGDSDTLAQANPAAWLCQALYQRVRLKLETEAVEDQRVDFEDGYGSRPDEEEDGHARTVAEAMAAEMQAGALPYFVGIRIKSLSEETKHRAIRTLDLFLTHFCSLTGGILPQNFRLTLPKVTTASQVSALCQVLDQLETKLGLPAKAIKLELMIETIQSVLNPTGESGIPGLVEAGQGRVTAAALGTYDYTATCNIASTHQDHQHPSADFCRQMMQVALTGTDVTLCDGITNIMPIPPHRGGELNQAQLVENISTVHAAWRVHFANVTHSLRLGFYQGWDLNPAQLPIRYAAVYYFFLTGLEASAARLTRFIEQAAQASMVGNVFDDAASGQGLLNFFISGMNCGALTEAEVLATGITLAELESKSFMTIVENRTRQTHGSDI